MTEPYLERVAMCRIPGREMTLKKRLVALATEIKAIRSELAQLKRLKEALR